MTAASSYSDIIYPPSDIFRYLCQGGQRDSITVCDFGKSAFWQ
jgi:hypothetical protein